jgi:spore germination protein YaaH
MNVPIKVLFAVFLVSLITLLSSRHLFSPATPHDKPIPSSTSKEINFHGQMVFGYLPYWTLNSYDTSNLKHLSHLAYFSISLDSEGHVISDVGLARLNSPRTKHIFDQATSLDIHKILTITILNFDTIEQLLNNQASMDRAIKSIIDITKTYDFVGINIDFEAKNQFSSSTRDSFTTFMRNLDRQCKNSIPNCQLSVAIYANPNSQNQLWDHQSLAFLDYIIVMAYDYHRASSNFSGPVSPLRGKCHTEFGIDCLSQDISHNIASQTQYYPTRKLVLGIAFYGYQWQTASHNPISNTYPKTGKTLQYKQVSSLVQTDQGNTQYFFSHTFLTPYLITQKDDKTYITHFEDSTSIGLKIDLVKQARLGGVAIWALGFEGQDQEVWRTIESLSDID